MTRKIKILCVVGARPNFMKISPLLGEFEKNSKFRPILVHTGQHYDYEMSESFFKNLNIPKPNYNLEVGSGPHGWQTGKIMIEFEKVCLKEKPCLVIVVGDVNSTLAGALTAIKLHIPVAHIEAGLRSFDRTMPEEINRLLTDQIADYLFVSDPAGIKNLIQEGIPRQKIFYVGNIMIDTLLRHKSEIRNPKSETNLKSQILKRLNIKKNQYAVLTLHRPSNVDDKKTLKNLFQTFEIVQNKIKIIYPIHPRTQKKIKEFGFEKWVQGSKNLILIQPVGYLDMLNLMINSKFVLTDSGGIAEESTVLNIPCLTLRKNTERPITVKIGTNIIVGTNKNKILKEVNKILSNQGKKGKCPKYWDGKTCQRIVKILIQKYQ